MIVFVFCSWSLQSAQPSVLNKIVWQIMAVETKSCQIRSSFIQSQQTYRDLPNQVSQTFWALQRGRIIQNENLRTLKRFIIQN